MKDDQKQSTLAAVHSLTQFSDAKAGILITLQTAAIAYFVPAAKESMKSYCQSSFWLYTWKTALLASIAFAVFSLFLTALSIFPRLDVGQPVSNIFFGHIGKLKSFDEYKQRLLVASLNYSDDLTGQIWACSKIASIKYTLVGWGTRFSFASLLLLGAPWVVDLVLTTVSKT